MRDHWWLSPWMAAPVLIGLLGAIVLAAGIGALVRRRPYSAIGGIFSGGLFLALGAVILLLGLDVQTYRRLSFERPVATLQLHQTGDNAFDVTIAEAAGEQQPRSFHLSGDEWRIEARVLKWKPWANVLGLDARYRLERLAGEFTDSAAEAAGPHSIVDLGGPERWGQLADWGQRLNRLDLIDTLYGSAAIMPMADGAFQMSAYRSGCWVDPTEWLNLLDHFIERRDPFGRLRLAAPVFQRILRHPEMLAVSIGRRDALEGGRNL
jgi:hypothetical protein